MSHKGLGEFEQMVLLAIVRLSGEVYGVPIVDEIERQTGRSVIASSSSNCWSRRVIGN